MGLILQAYSKLKYKSSRRTCLLFFIILLSYLPLYSQGLFEIEAPIQYYGIVQLSNEKIVAGGAQGQLELTQIDTMGNILWSKRYTDTVFLFGSGSLCKLYDNSTIISANRKVSINCCTSNLLLAKVDTLGNVNWAFTNSSLSSNIYGVVSTLDSCLLLSYGNSGSSIGKVMKLNSQGNIMWKKQYNCAGKILSTHDNGFIIYSTDNNYNIYISKFDSLGNFTWSYSWTLSAPNDILDNIDVIQCADKGFACFAPVMDQPIGLYYRGVFMKIDSIGNLINSSIIDSVTAMPYGHRLFENLNGDIVLTEGVQLTILNASGQFKYRLMLPTLIGLVSLNQSGYMATTEFNSIVKLDSSFMGCCIYPLPRTTNFMPINLYRQNVIVTSSSGIDTLVPLTLTVNINNSLYYRCSDNHAPLSFQITSNDSLPICKNEKKLLSLKPGQICFNYQWKFNGADIPAANSFNYLAGDSGYYSCVISNNSGLYQTDSFLVVVHSLPSPSLTTTPARAFCVNDSILLATDSASVAYLWLPDSTNAPSLYVNSAGLYSVIATNLYGCTREESIFIRRDSLLPGATTLFVSNPSSCISEPHNLSLSPLSGNYLYQWMCDSVPIVGGNYIYVSLNLKDTGYYYCLITNGCGTVASDSFYYEPRNTIPPNILPDTNVFLCFGDTVTLSASNGNSYVWYIHYPLSGWTAIFNDSLLIDSAQTYVLHYTDFTGCEGITNVHVNSIGTVLTSATHSDSVCYLGSPILLNCSPPGGLYLGNAVVGDYFFPGLSVQGWNKYVYSFIDTSGCTNEIYDSVKVYIPNITPATHSDSLCFSTTPFFINCIPVGGVYSGSAINSGFFYPSLATSGWNNYQYHYTDSLGCSFDYYDSVYISTCTYIDKVESGRFNFYPNPVNDMLFVENKLTQNCEVIVYSLEGQVVLRVAMTGNERSKYPLTFAPGLYILQLNSPDFSSNYRLVKY